MGIYLNRGNDLFTDAKNREIFVDKSMLIHFCNLNIRDYMNSRFMCVTRLRRSGKTMALEMLNAYYSKGCDSRELFHGLKIENDPSFEKHLNKHNVIWIDMGGAFCEAWGMPSFISRLATDIIDDLQESFPMVSLNRDKPLADNIENIYNQLGETFIFLIDEWDIVLREKMDDTRFCQQYMDFLRSLFKNISTAPAIDLVYMTGILPIIRTASQSGLNNFDEYDMLDPRGLGEFFGFTQEEVDNLCDKFNMGKKEMRDWYNGYHYDGFDIYNPWSIDNAIQDRKCAEYWNKTSGTGALTEYINYDNGAYKDLTMRLLAGGSIKINPRHFENDLRKIRSIDAALTVLVHYGYLTFDEENNTCRIPNYEISQEFGRAAKILKWSEVVNPISMSDRLIKETFLGNTDYINEALDRNHREIAGPFNKNKEDILGVIVELSYYNMVKDYVIAKEETNILGRADIIFHPKKSGKPPMIVELKVDDTPENALKQIEEKGYLSSLEGYKGKVYLLGISYDSRTLKHTSRIKTVEI